MNIDRVRQIVESSQQIGVLFEGDQVWIDDYDTPTQTVSIHSLTNGKTAKVSADRLHEQ